MCRFGIIRYRFGSNVPVFIQHVLFWIHYVPFRVYYVPVMIPPVRFGFMMFRFESIVCRFDIDYDNTPKVDASEAISKMAGLDGEGGRWDEFDVAAEAFQEMVEEQKESLKGVLEEEVMQLNQVRMSWCCFVLVVVFCG